MSHRSSSLQMVIPSRRVLSAPRLPDERDAWRSCETSMLSASARRNRSIEDQARASAIGRIRCALVICRVPAPDRRPAVVVCAVGARLDDDHRAREPGIQHRSTRWAGAEDYGLICARRCHSAQCRDTHRCRLDSDASRVTRAARRASVIPSCTRPRRTRRRVPVKPYIRPGHTRPYVLAVRHRTGLTALRRRFRTLIDLIPCRPQHLPAPLLARMNGNVPSLFFHSQCVRPAAHA